MLKTTDQFHFSIMLPKYWNDLCTTKSLTIFPTIFSVVSLVFSNTGQLHNSCLYILMILLLLKMKLMPYIWISPKLLTVSHTKYYLTNSSQ